VYEQTPLGLRRLPQRRRCGSSTRRRASRLASARLASAGGKTTGKGDGRQIGGGVQAHLPESGRGDELRVIGGKDAGWHRPDQHKVGMPGRDRRRRCRPVEFGVQQPVSGAPSRPDQLRARCRPHPHRRTSRGPRQRAGEHFRVQNRRQDRDWPPAAPEPSGVTSAAAARPEPATTDHPRCEPDAGPRSGPGRGWRKGRPGAAAGQAAHRRGSCSQAIRHRRCGPEHQVASAPASSRNDDSSRVSSNWSRPPPDVVLVGGFRRHEGGASEGVGNRS